MELKKKKPIYDIYADDVDEDGNKRLLAQYDDEIDPKKKKKAFVLTGSSSAITGEARQKQVAEKLKQKLVTISLDAPGIYYSVLFVSTPFFKLLT